MISFIIKKLVVHIFDVEIQWKLLNMTTVNVIIWLMWSIFLRSQDIDIRFSQPKVITLSGSYCKKYLVNVSFQAGARKSNFVKPAITQSPQKVCQIGLNILRLLS
jgi:hypothetical protein